MTADYNELPSVLACDCGNSKIRLAYVQGKDVTDVQTHRLGDLGDLGKSIADIWTKMPSPKYIVASSVNQIALNALEAAAHQATGEDVMVIGRDLDLPMEISTDIAEPKKIGVDRLCCAVAAFDQLGEACIIGDFGSAATIDCVNEEGVFMGGAILPGLAMSANALHEKTAQLPQIELTLPSKVFGTDTEQAILNGIVYGMRGALRELVESYATRLGAWPLVILTGGDAKLVSPNPNDCDIVQAIVDDLCLRGIAIAYYKSLL